MADALDMDEVALWRRHLHARPELGFEEVQTARFVAGKLRDFGIETHEGLARTGVVGVLNGRHGPGRVIGLRADMDALPMQEMNRFAHASTSAGRMHACGHDGHTAMLLGAAQSLAADPDFRGTVVFIFQPAEEALGGGKVMVEEGMLDRFAIQEVYGLHNWPQMPAGQIGVSAGPVMASVDFFRIAVSARGGHAAAPHLATDPIVAAAHIVTALQSIASRNAAPQDALVVSVTQFHAGSADNVIPESADLRGTVRCFTPEVRDLAERRMTEIAESVGTGLGVTAEVTYRRCFPATINDAEGASHAARAAARAVGADNVAGQTPPSMAGEDFAFMLEARPGAYVWLGQGGRPDSCMIHSPTYDFNDAVIPAGIAYWKAIVAERLGV